MKNYKYSLKIVKTYNIYISMYLKKKIKIQRSRRAAAHDVYFSGVVFVSKYIIKVIKSN